MKAAGLKSSRLRFVITIQEDRPRDWRATISGPGLDVTGCYDTRRTGALMSAFSAILEALEVKQE